MGLVLESYQDDHSSMNSAKVVGVQVFKENPYNLYSLKNTVECSPRERGAFLELGRYSPVGKNYVRVFPGIRAEVPSVPGS